MQVKSCLRAVPIHVSKWHIQACFDEFCFKLIGLDLITVFFIKRFVEW